METIEVLKDLRAEMVRAISELDGGRGSFMVTSIVMGQRAMLRVVEDKIKELEK